MIQSPHHLQVSRVFYHSLFHTITETAIIPEYVVIIHFPIFFIAINNFASGGCYDNTINFKLAGSFASFLLQVHHLNIFFSTTTVICFLQACKNLFHITIL